MHLIKDGIEILRELFANSRHKWVKTTGAIFDVEPCFPARLRLEITLRVNCVRIANEVHVPTSRFSGFRAGRILWIELLWAFAELSAEAT